MKGSDLYAYPAGTSFCSCKRKQNTLGGTPRPHAPERPLGTGCAVPKRGLNGAYKVSATHFYRLPRWSAEWRATTPLPSSEEGNYGAGGRILASLLNSLCKGEAMGNGERNEALITAHTIIEYCTTKRRRCQCVILCGGKVVILGQSCYTGKKGSKETANIADNIVY